MNEPMTARRITRLKFLEQESEQLRTYKSDLEYCLISTKQLLNEILSAKVIISHRRMDYSGDTEISSHVPIKTLEQALEKNFKLVSELKKLKVTRDMTLGKVLINEQLAEETIRKEHEIIQESEDQTNDIKYVIDKKELRITNLKGKIDMLESQISKFKNESLIVLELNENNLNLFKEVERIKKNLSKVSKKLQITEMQTEDLKGHYETLCSLLDQYKIFIKNPMMRTKKSANMNSTQNLDMTFEVSLPDSDSSSSEISFPDKLQIQAKFKPNLPKLDFTKVVKQNQSEKSINNKSYIQIKSKNEYLEKKCKEKTDLLNHLRQQIKLQLEKNSKLAQQLQGKKSEFLNKPADKPKKKRAMSNTLDYIFKNPNDIIEPSDDKREVTFEDSFENISSFNDSEVDKLDYHEPDSILAEYIHEIINE